MQDTAESDEIILLLDHMNNISRFVMIVAVGAFALLLLLAFLGYLYFSGLSHFSWP